ncbi:kidney mitochondrial carrier protein 1-like isoform X3 [Acropora millepora]|uniref:kidney mitochondrial carrier protein 1-like isoform X3 n=1 Tax=Acropora millepora TaxID=45264 RepID=UPI001CF0E7CF|nr:kidney mitochondrial carrier protein 1-like isoform X3 [Acropora millepora]
MDYRPFIYGGLASMTAEFGTFPIDTTKTRLQLQGQVIDMKQKEIRYRGMLHAFAKIAKDDGLKALFNGVAPALLRQASYGSLKLGFYHALKRKLVNNPKDETLFFNIFAGMVAGGVSSAMCNPTDVLKIRMQAQYQSGSNEARKGMMGSFASMFKEEGIRGLYRGVGPTAYRATVIAGVELPVYDWVKKKILDFRILDDNPYTHFWAIGKGLKTIQTDKHPSTIYRSAIGRLSIDILEWLDQVLTDHRPSVDQLLTDTSVKYRTTIG